jgi:hypothetical protein
MKCECKLCNNCKRRERYATDPVYKQREIDKAYKRTQARLLIDKEFKEKHQLAKCETDKERYHSDLEYNKKKNKASAIRSTLRQKRLKQATPKWVDLSTIKEFYNNRPEGYHVDHIMPIKGKNFSGLNVLWNLQYLPAQENLKKSNK